jgi:hypothetical protein
MRDVAILDAYHLKSEVFGKHMDHVAIHELVEDFVRPIVLDRVLEDKPVDG